MVFFCSGKSNELLVSMSTPPDQLEQRIRLITRSGRSVRPPNRYEPESDQTFEDDFSDEESEWGIGEEPKSDQEDAEQLEHSESSDGSYELASDAVSSSEDDDFFADTDREDEETQDDDNDEEEDEDVEDTIEWDRLTADASDPDLSEDDQDL